ncbi:MULTISPECIES: Ohr family peroxiredoxin [unclassified Pseudovibrio]|uniref:Ohr family peroxiredoxin n=1 Tax=unclassified Pseudovibrio TaxID=2627060 RepID=UPI0007B2B14A|nr:MULTISPECIES: Ohr family peroxiredoxin [unclassified Pseudovibrio]KZL25968.1 Organic hydroperoxide resistance protein OhrB [Pseudovibrio sp. WM33]KZL26729.1 Organic hydroperoxide resistance protein OhrB [Pseudovibrio sp. Ad37]
MKVFYDTDTTAENGRSGTLTLSDEAAKIRVTPPGTEGAGITPEELFAMGYASCFEYSLKMVSGHKEYPLDFIDVRASGSVVEKDEGGFVLDIELHLEFSGLTREQADDVIQAANSLCPYSNAICGNVDVRVYTKLNS